MRVSKTLTPDQDGDAVGGSIDFRTPHRVRLQRPAPSFASMAAAGFNQQAPTRPDETAASYQAQADFGPPIRRRPLRASSSPANYGVSPGNGQETENDGEWEPYNWRKDSEEAIDESNMHLPGIDLDYRRLEQTRYGGNFSLRLPRRYDAALPARPVFAAGAAAEPTT